MVKERGGKEMRVEVRRKELVDGGAEWEEELDEENDCTAKMPQIE
jgi:hypothetical protein